MNDQSTVERFSDYDKHYYAPESSVRIMPGLARSIAAGLRGDILDIGTGDGLKLVQLLELADIEKIDNVVVCEPSPMYKAAKKNLEQFPFVSVVKTPFAELATKGRFDVVLMFEVIEHIDDTVQAVSDIKTLLKPGGEFIGSTPNRPVFRLNCLLTGHDDPTHVSEMNVKELRLLLRRFFRHCTLKGFLPLAFLFRKFPKLDAINRRFPPSLSRTVYFFCRDDSNLQK
jgi:2-polyprenyl-3-methyl-5-hydroxy-6-metoxy-1,4-benzoquinol methylase